MNRFLLIPFLICLLILSACDKKSSTSDENPLTLVYSVQDLNNPYFSALSNGAQDRAQELGLKLIIHDGESDVNKQITALTEYMERGVDIVICSPVIAEELDDVVALAHSKNIPFINPNQAVKGYDALIGLDEYEFGFLGGEIAADWIAEKLNGRAKAAIIGYPYMQDLKDRAQGIEDAIINRNPDAEIVAYGTANTPEAGMNETLNILKQHPDVKVISCINDAGALGAMEAVKSLGLDSSEFCITGLDATAEALDKMNEPGSIFRGTVDIDPYGTGLIVIDTALWVLEKGPIRDLIPIPMKPVVQ